MEDGPGSEDDLRKGMIITVRGEVSDDGKNGTALEVEFEDDLEGPISQIDTINSFLVAMGRTVIVDAGTIIKDHHDSRFDDAEDNITPRLSLSDLNINDMVEVSGRETTNGDILAWRIERKTEVFQPGATPVEVKGIVSNHDGIQLTFNLGALLVDYSGAIQVEGPLADGLFVEAKGTLNQAKTTMDALFVELEDDAMGKIGKEHLEIEGLITNITSNTLFEVEGKPVDASKAVFVNGSADDLALNVRVEVEGSMAGANLLAKKVKFRGLRVKIESHIQGDPSDNVLVALGISVAYNHLTENKNGPLSADDPVEIRGFVSGGEVTATRIVRVNEIKPDDILLQGPVDEGFIIPGSSFNILGVIIDTTAAKFEDENEVQITAGEFYDRLKAKMLVKARCVFNGTNTFFADKVEFEN